MSKTKIAGILMIIVAVLTPIATYLNGGHVDLGQAFQSFLSAMTGAGFVFLRDAIGKLEGGK